MLTQTQDQGRPAHLSWNFAWATVAGILFQGGVAFLDTGTVVAAFIAQLTPSAVAVGAAELIARFGWFGPQIFAAYFALGRPYRKPIYLLGGWGRAIFLGLLALWLLVRPPGSPGRILALFFMLWTLYAFISGLAGVPYNDIIGRTIPSQRRSRLLAWRFLGGGLLAVAAGFAVQAILSRPGAYPFPISYGLIFALAAGTLALSTLAFAQVREPPAPLPVEQPGFGDFLKRGLTIARADARFRTFVVVQWLEGVTWMVTPFYILQAQKNGLGGEAVGLFLTVRMVGEFLFNPLWGWWGDKQGKRSLVRTVAAVSLLSPALALLLPLAVGEGWQLAGYGGVFFFTGAVSAGAVIANLGYLMEISPDDQRPAYSGYMNALVAPTRLFPLLAGVLAELLSFQVIFFLAALAAGARVAILSRPELADGRPADV